MAFPPVSRPDPGLSGPADFAVPAHPDAPRPTTIVLAPRLSSRLGAEVVIAAETFQTTGSFKFRAAWNVARSVPHPRIITASSGNFGQALARACQLTGKGCTVVMPSTSAPVKVDAVRAYGATVDLVDTRVVPREVRVAELAARDPDAYVASAYDDPLVIAGNATLGHELAHYATAHGAFDAVIVPVGGGGLSSGIVTGLRARHDMTPVYGAEPAMANDAARSLRAGAIVANIDEPQTIADGARTRALGVHPWAILQHGLAGIIEVPESGIVNAVGALFLLANLKVEPTGALATAAVMQSTQEFHGKRVCVIASGGNVDVAVYRDVLAAAQL